MSDGVPQGYVAYRRSPEFTADTVPAALLKEHRIKSGVCALICVLEGKLRYCIEDPRSETIIGAADSALVAPEVPHHIEPLGPVRFYIEFYHNAHAQAPALGLPHEQP